MGIVVVVVCVFFGRGGTVGVLQPCQQMGRRAFDQLLISWLVANCVWFVRLG